MTRPSRMTVERLMRHLSANEYRDSWAKREQRAGQTLWRRAALLTPHLVTLLRK